VTAPRWSRLFADPRRRLAAVGVGAACLLLLVLAPGELGPVAARGGLVVLALAAGTVLLRRRRPGDAAEVLAVISSRALSREAGIAVVEVQGRRVLVGFGGGGVRVLAEVPSPGPGERP
jgi:flagellar protein FliO/FliZ